MEALKQEALEVLRQLLRYEPNPEETDEYFHIECMMGSDDIVELGNTLRLLNVLQVQFESRLSLALAGHVEPIVIGFSRTFSTIEVEQLTQSNLEAIEQYNDLELIKQIARTYEEHETYPPEDFFQLIKTETSMLMSKGATWQVFLSVSKRPFAQFLEEDYASGGMKASVVMFLTENRFLEFIKDSGLEGLYTKALLSGKHLIVAIGNLNATFSGRYLTITELWENRPELSSVQTHMADSGELTSRHDFVQKSVSPGIAQHFLLPEFFDMDILPLPRTRRGLASAVEVIQALNAVLCLSTYAVEHDSKTWIVRMIGDKTFESQVTVAKGHLLIDGENMNMPLPPLLELYRWTFSSKDAVKATIVRKTASLHASSYQDLLLDIRHIRRSAEAAYEQYLDATVSEILEINQRFTEYLFDWTVKDIDLSLRLRGILSDTILGGLGSIMGTTLGLVTQYFQPNAGSVVTAVVPWVFLFYLVLVYARIGHIGQDFETYVSHHEKQIVHYKRIIGEKSVDEIVGGRNPQTLRKEFSRRKSDYRNLVVALGVATILLWVVLNQELLVRLRVLFP